MNRAVFFVCEHIERPLIWTVIVLAGITAWSVIYHAVIDAIWR